MSVLYSHIHTYEYKRFLGSEEGQEEEKKRDGREQELFQDPYLGWTKTTYNWKSLRLEFGKYGPFKSKQTDRQSWRMAQR